MSVQPLVGYISYSASTIAYRLIINSLIVPLLHFKTYVAFDRRSRNTLGPTAYALSHGGDSAYTLLFIAGLIISGLIV